MKRRRVRMECGPGGVMYVFVAVMIAALAVYAQANLLFWGVGVMVGGLCASLVMLWGMMHRLEVERLLPDHAVEGEPLVIRYRLANGSRLPLFNLVVCETWGRGNRGWKRTGPIAASPQRLSARPQGWVLHIGPRQTLQAEAMCWPLQRGELRFERIVVSVIFPFGILRKVIRLDQPGRVLVFPRLHRLNRRLVASLADPEPLGRRQQQRGGGTEEFFGLRPYREGDSLKTIDWKRSARTGELVSRELTRPSPPRVLLMLDLTREQLEQPGDAEAMTDPEKPSAQSHPRERVGFRGRGRLRDRHLREARVAVTTARRQRLEQAISLTASLICDAHQYGYEVGLRVRGAACPAFGIHHSLPHRTRMLDALARLDIEPAMHGRAVPQRAAAEAGSGFQASTIVHPGWAEGTQRGEYGQVVRVLGAAELSRYVHAGESASSLLSRRVRQTLRREQVKEAKKELEGVKGS